MSKRRLHKKPCDEIGCPNLTYHKYCEQHSNRSNRVGKVPCKYKGCSNFVTSDRQTYCDYHARIIQHPYAHLYSSVQWKELRAKQLEHEPMCCECGTPANTVDHKKPHKGNMNLFLDPFNLCSMCHSCHTKKTNKEDNPNLLGRTQSIKDNSRSTWNL